MFQFIFQSPVNQQKHLQHLLLDMVVNVENHGGGIDAFHVEEGQDVCFVGGA